MSYRNASTESPATSNYANNMTHPIYPPYSYSVDPAAAYYQQQQPATSLSSGSVSPEGPNYSTLYGNPDAPRAMTGVMRSRRSPEVGMDDPTQPRRYISASTTSRKDIPSYFARRQPGSGRAQSIPSDEEDELTEEPPAANATDQEKIEYKRRQNTLAARRSRRRKTQYTQNLAETVEKLKMEKEVWKTRALTLKQLLHSHGVPCPDFAD